VEDPHAEKLKRKVPGKDGGRGPFWDEFTVMLPAEDPIDPFFRKYPPFPEIISVEGV
jgi:hypothetical protein